MLKALHPRSDIDRLYLSRKGGRVLVSIQDSVDASIQQLEDYIKKYGGRLITVTRNNTQATQASTKQKYQEHKNEKKNHCMNISSDKYMKSLLRKLRHG